jgi:fumarate reductase subunit D
MSRGRSNEPFFWSLFSSGGMLSALVMPALAFVVWFAIPQGWVETPGYDHLRRLVGHPLVRLGLFTLITLSAFHWGHRFRFTLYDGLQLHHLFGLIATVCYGGAVLISILGAWVLWSL